MTLVARKAASRSFSRQSPGHHCWELKTFCPFEFVTEVAFSTAVRSAPVRFRKRSFRSLVYKHIHRGRQAYKCIAEVVGCGSFFESLARNSFIRSITTSNSENDFRP